MKPYRIGFLVVISTMSYCCWRAEARSAENIAIAENPKINDAINVLDAWIESKVNQREQPGLSIRNRL